MSKSAGLDAVKKPRLALFYSGKNPETSEAWATRRWFYSSWTQSSENPLKARLLWIWNVPDLALKVSYDAFTCIRGQETL